jgi:UDP-N-acetyl-D-mannosaminuronic acid dehydrogenase
MNVCIFGLGRIGLAISLVAADSGYRVVGIDVNRELISGLKRGEIPFSEPGLVELLDKHLGDNFIPINSEADGTRAHLKEADYIILAVGTGFAKYPEKPDLSEKKTGLKEGKDFWLSFVPERIMEGKAVEEERKLPKIVGSYNDKGFFRVSDFFEKIGGDIIRVSNPKTAEFIKLIDNSWRNTRFAFANELAYLAEANGIDALEAIESANQGYKRNEIPIPGPVSGYCLGKDPYLLELAFNNIKTERGFNSLWYYGRRANDWLYDKIVKEVEGKNVLVVGLTFKDDIDDFRYSHGIEIVKKLLKKDFSVFVHDPYLDKNAYTTLPRDIKGKVTQYNSLKDAIMGADTAIFATCHQEYKEFDWNAVLDEKNVPLTVFDLWGMFRDLREERLVAYKGFGIGNVR